MVVWEKRFTRCVVELRIGDRKWVMKKERQSGFTLVNLAGLVVSGGLALGVAVQGPGVVNDFRYASFYKELKTLENQAWEYRDDAGRWPGDCRASGVIEPKPENKSSLVMQTISNDANACSSGEELRQAGLLDDEQVEKGLVHDFDGYFQLGHALLDESGKKVGNVIVAYGLPTDVAHWLDHRVDGSMNGEHGRIRRWDEQDKGSAWPSDAKQTVSVAYFFDQKLPDEK